MAKFVMKDAYIAIGGTNVSDHCSDVSLEDKADEIDVTSMGPAAYKQFIQGFHDATITATFFSDFAANQVHSILQPLYSAGSTFLVEVRPTSGTPSATNPKAQMTSTMYSYSGIAGKIGAAAEMTVAFRNAGTAGLVWGTV